MSEPSSSDVVARRGTFQVPDWIIEEVLHGVERIEAMLTGAIGKHLTYRELTQFDSIREAEQIGHCF